MKLKKFQSNPILSKFYFVKSVHLNLNKLPVKSFSSTPVRKGDPLGVVVISFSTPYSFSFLANPFGGSFTLLMGLATVLYFLTTDLITFFSQDHEYGTLLQRLDNIFLLYERFISYEQSGINLFLANIDNHTPEALRQFYLSFQELVTVRESLYNRLSDVMNLPQMQFVEEPLIDRVNQTFEDLRSGGNNLMSLVRGIENRLNIPEQERIPPFWFEE